MTVMTDAFKKVFLGLGGNPKELAENNDVGDYIVDLENAIKAYVASQIPEVPTQAQADWNQADDTAVDYIKNKPTIPEDELPAVTADDNGKILAVVDGAWTKVTLTAVADTSTGAVTITLTPDAPVVEEPAAEENT